MAKIGTAQIEIKPVVSEEALNIIMERIAVAVAAGVRRGMAEIQTVQDVQNTTTEGTATP